MSGETLQKKRKALKYFTKKLLQSKVGKDIERIVLFGSLAHGRTDKYSDLDVAVFAKRPKRVENFIDELTYDILVEQGEDIDAQIYSLTDLQNPRSYFAWQIVNKGEPIYS